MRDSEIWDAKYGNCGDFKNQTLCRPSSICNWLFGLYFRYLSLLRSIKINGMKAFFAFFLALLLWNAAAAQTFLETQRDLGPQSFPEFQRQLDTWSRQNRIAKVKGWKWMKRWEDFETQRMNPDGSLFDWAEYAKGAQSVIDQKAAAAKVATGTSWYPLGPNDS